LVPLPAVWACSSFYATNGSSADFQQKNDYQGAFRLPTFLSNNDSALFPVDHYQDRQIRPATIICSRHLPQLEFSTATDGCRALDRMVESAEQGAVICDWFHTWLPPIYHWSCPAFLPRRLQVVLISVNERFANTLGARGPRCHRSRSRGGAGWPELSFITPLDSSKPNMVDIASMTFATTGAASAF
jgi:hypothetical protein